MIFKVYSSLASLALLSSGCIGTKDFGWPLDTGADDEHAQINNSSACGSWSDATGAEPGYGNYPDSSASSGPECLCDFSVSAGGSYHVRAVAVSGQAQRYADQPSGALPTVELSGVCPVRSAEPDGEDVGPVTHHLMLELEGTNLATGVPLVQVAPEVWSLDTSGERFSATGTVTRSQAGLTLDLHEAWIDGLGQLSEMSWSAMPSSR